MEATTTTCPKCEDRGVVHVQVMAGCWSIGQCDCRPPEYWKAESDRKMAEFKKRLDEARKQFGGGEEGGEV
jgi:hypothetical protein